MKKYVVLFVLIAIVCGSALVWEPTPAKAWNCALYNFAVSRDGVVTVQNDSSNNEPGQSAYVYIDGSLVANFSVPALSAHTGATLGTVSTPGDDGFSWSVLGTVDCGDSGEYEEQHEHNPIKICHATPPDTAADGWHEITIDDDAVVKQGHDGHAADIIPDFWYWDKQGPDWDYLYYPGKNWDTTGQEIWNNGCTVPEPPQENHLNLAVNEDCDGWEVIVDVNDEPTIVANPGLSGLWNGQTSQVVVVTATWSEGEPLTITEEVTVNKPGDCEPPVVLSIEIDQWNHCDAYERSARLLVNGQGVSSFVVVASGVWNGTPESLPELVTTVTFTGTGQYDGTYPVTFPAMEAPSDCEEPPVYGCTDPDAENYDPEATVDDESCKYATPEPTPTPEPTDPWNPQQAVCRLYGVNRPVGSVQSWVRVDNNAYLGDLLVQEDDNGVYVDLVFGTPETASYVPGQYSVGGLQFEVTTDACFFPEASVGQVTMIDTSVGIPNPNPTAAASESYLVVGGKTLPVNQAQLSGSGVLYSYDHEAGLYGGSLLLVHINDVPELAFYEGQTVVYNGATYVLVNRIERDINAPVIDGSLTLVTCGGWNGSGYTANIYYQLQLQ